MFDASYALSLLRHMTLEQQEGHFWSLWWEMIIGDSWMRSTRGRKVIMNYNKVNLSHISCLKVDKTIHFAILTMHDYMATFIWLSTFSIGGIHWQYSNFLTNVSNLLKKYIKMQFTCTRNLIDLFFDYHVCVFHFDVFKILYFLKPH